MMTGLEERERLRAAFGSYVDPAVARRVVEEGELLEGEEREVTVVWIDIVGFTAFAERASAEETVTYLNEFFDVVVPLLSRHLGHANKFIGDGVMGLFGALRNLPDHADRALAAALDIERAVAERWEGARRIGIGLNSGPVSAGSIGGGGRLEFTVIGDTVNVASRVEALTRSTGDTILLTEQTRALLTGPQRNSLYPRGSIELKGREESVRVWTPSVPSPVTRHPSTEVRSAE
jgi:class 3 adenylate cyclase